MTRGLLAGMALVLVALALYPVVGSGYGLRAMLHLFMWIALAQSWNLISGFTGYVSLGHVAFFGTGAYTAALLVVRMEWAWLPASLAGGVAAALLALLIGAPCLRLRGPYFAFAMLGLNEVLRVLVSYFEGVTGGSLGLALPALDASTSIYYAMGALALAVTALVHLVATSRVGLRLMSIREDEEAAAAMGIATLRYKLFAFLLSAVGPGIAGGLAARDQGYLEPISVFSLGTTLTMIAMALLGGAGTVWGPVLGAAVLFGAQEVAWARFPYAHQFLLGALVVAVVLAMPRGIMGVVQRRHRLSRAA